MLKMLHIAGALLILVSTKFADNTGNACRLPEYNLEGCDGEKTLHCVSERMKLLTDNGKLDADGFIGNLKLYVTDQAKFNDVAAEIRACIGRANGRKPKLKKLSAIAKCTQKLAPRMEEAFGCGSSSKKS